MNTIVVDYDPFVMDARIWFVNDNDRKHATVASTIPELAEAAVDFANEQDTANIKIHAPLSIFSEIKREIELAQKTKYSDNKSLNIEVI